MTVEMKQIKMTLFLLLMLQITVASGKISSVVKQGDDAILSCANVNMHDCSQIGFMFSMETYQTHLVQGGQIQQNGKVTTDRLRMTANCSLVIKEVKPEHAGRYHCQEKSGYQVQYTENFLSVVTINEQEDDEKTILTCIVSTYIQCTHPVKWLYKGKEVTENDKILELSQVVCNSTVTFNKYINKKMFTCKVEDKHTSNFHLFPFRPQSSGGDTTSPSTRTKTTQDTKSTTTNLTTCAIGCSPITGFGCVCLPDWRWYIIVAVGLVVLLVIVIVIIKWRKNKGSKKQKNSGIVVSLHTAENTQDTVDPDNNICYASVNYTKKTKCTNQVPDVDDEEDAVMYSEVKHSHYSVVPSAELNDVYTVVRK